MGENKRKKKERGLESALAPAPKKQKTRQTVQKVTLATLPEDIIIYLISVLILRSDLQTLKSLCCSSMKASRCLLGFHKRFIDAIKTNGVQDDYNLLADIFSTYESCLCEPHLALLINSDGKLELCYKKMVLNSDPYRGYDNDQIDLYRNKFSSQNYTPLLSEKAYIRFPYGKDLLIEDLSNWCLEHPDCGLHLHIETQDIFPENGDILDISQKSIDIIQKSIDIIKNLVSACSQNLTSFCFNQFEYDAMEKQSQIPESLVKILQQNCPKLHRLKLDYCGLDDGYVNQFFNLISKVKTLCIYRSMLFDMGGQAISTYMKNLTVLSIAGCNIEVNSLIGLSTLSSLKELHLNGNLICNFSQSRLVLEQMDNMPNLKHFTLAFSDGVLDVNQSIAGVIKKMPNLLSLDLERGTSSPLKDVFLITAISALTKLKYLNLSNNGVSAMSIMFLLASLKKLRHILVQDFEETIKNDLQKDIETFRIIHNDNGLNIDGLVQTSIENTINFVKERALKKKVTVSLTF